MIEGPLKADGRLAAKNATKIRAALTQVTNFKSVFNRYQETQPQPTDDKAKDRARARAWLMLNVGFNNEALHNAIMHAWAEAYVLGQDAAGEWIRKAEKAQKSVSEMINWDTWKPGDRATALLIKPIGGFQRYLEQSGGASYFKKFDKETVEMLGTSLADAIEAGLDSESAALLMKNHVGSAGRALTIAITEQNRAMSFSTIQRYKEAELQKMEWHVSDPCPKCAQNSGQVIEIGGTFNSGNQQPPAHPHCRCVLLPVIPGFEEDGGIGGTTTAPVVTPAGNIEQKPLTPNVPPTSQNWTPMTPERWIERRQAERVKNGFPPYEGRQLEVLQQQANDARAMWERGPHVVRWDKSSTKPDEKHVLGFMKNFDEALTKLPEWRRFDENGIERGYAAVISAEAGGNTLAYTYLGNNTIWFSNTSVMRSLDLPYAAQGLAPNPHKMPAQSTINENLYTILHELGHTVDSSANNAIRGRFTAPLRRKYKTLWSGYSRKDPDEAYAEVFAQWAGGEHNELTDAFAEKFGWNLSAQEYKEKIQVQWKPNIRNQNIGG